MVKKVQSQPSIKKVKLEIKKKADLRIKPHYFIIFYSY